MRVRAKNILRHMNRQVTQFGVFLLMKPDCRFQIAISVCYKIISGGIEERSNV